jgi:hypothetical protein
VRYQQAYQASAKVISVAQTLFDQLLNPDLKGPSHDQHRHQRLLCERISGLNKRKQTGQLQTQISTGNDPQLCDDPWPPRRCARFRPPTLAKTTMPTPAPPMTLTQTDIRSQPVHRHPDQITSLATQAPPPPQRQPARLSIGHRSAAITTAWSIWRTPRTPMAGICSPAPARARPIRRTPAAPPPMPGRPRLVISLGGAMTVTPSVTGPELMNYQSKGGRKTCSPASSRWPTGCSGHATADQMNATAALDQLGAATQSVDHHPDGGGHALSGSPPPRTYRPPPPPSAPRPDPTWAAPIWSPPPPAGLSQQLALDASQASFIKLSGFRCSIT